MGFYSARRKTEPQDSFQSMPSPQSGLVKEKSFRGTTLTVRQWEVIRYRAQGLTQAQVAKKVNTTRENVSEIERRARLKINAARATLAALQQMDATSQLLIPSGVSEYEALSMIISRADILGVKLLSSSDDMLAALRSKCKGKIRRHHLTSVVRIEISSGGCLSFNTAI
jgi:Tfx family DNA-binding protein